MSIIDLYLNTAARDIFFKTCHIMFLLCLNCGNGSHSIQTQGQSLNFHWPIIGSLMFWPILLMIYSSSPCSFCLCPCQLWTSALAALTASNTLPPNIRMLSLLKKPVLNTQFKVVTQVHPWHSLSPLPYFTFFLLIVHDPSNIIYNLFMGIAY